jgi:hypothetical protein
MKYFLMILFRGKYLQRIHYKCGVYSARVHDHYLFMLKADFFSVNATTNYVTKLYWDGFNTRWGTEAM